jgi:shikimate kinase
MKDDGKLSYFLIGFMGVGKTSIGRNLAKHLQLDFVDLDELIERESGKSIVEIFSKEGEKAFRRIETQMLHDVAQRGPAVVSTGGGTFTKPENRDIIRSSGISIWLDAHPELIRSRGVGSNRPLWRSAEQAMQLLEERTPYYGLADIRFELENWSPEEAAEQLVKILRSDSRHEIPNTQ